ncbi:MAG: MXAN_6640 family putative metalloprotease [Rhodothermaceae bacterium]
MKLIKTCTLLILFFSAVVSAQDPDSLFNYFIGNNSIEGEIAVGDRNESVDGKKPSLLTTENLIRYNFNQFSGAQQALLKGMLTRLELHKSVVSPSGFFRIHYDTSGVHKPAYSIDDLTKILDDVYAYEITELGYPAPPTDGEKGGDSKYDIYIRKNTANWGVTHIENKVGDNTWTSYMELDNDFSDKRVTGLDAVRITCAHEFHHAIQVGNFTFSPSDVWYHEITSTSMEEFMYDDVNDYYFEIHHYMNGLSVSLPSSPKNGYDTTIWNLYLKKKFGIGIIKEIWFAMRENRAINAIAVVLLSKGSNFKKEFEEFSTWLYFTGSRAKEGKYFEEAASYPLLKPANEFKFTEENYSKEMLYLTKPVSNNFITYIDSSVTPKNEITVKITNSDYSSTVSGYETFPVTFTFTKGDDDGEKIIKDYYYKLQINDGNQYIGTEFFFNGNLASEGVDPADNDLAEFVFPQPYKPAKHGSLFFTTQNNDQNYAKLYIFSITMELLYSGELDLQENGKYPIVRWDGKTDSGKRLSSGVYIYVVDSNGKLTKGKFAVLNE